MIKDTLKTEGWKQIEQKFKDRIVNLTLAKNIENVSYKEIAIEVLAKKKAAELVESVLLELNNILKNKINTPENYR